MLREHFPEIASVEQHSPLGRTLVSLCALLDKGEADATRDFVDGLKLVLPRLRRYALSLARDPAQADDLVQFAMLKAWEHRAQFRPGTSLAAWLQTILRNGFINGKRKYRLEVPDPDGTHASGLVGLPDQEHRVDLGELTQAMDRLEPLQRQALILVAVEGMTYEDAASVFGCPPGTVKSRVSRARERLAREMA